MNLSDKLSNKGHITVTKIDKVTGEETILFKDNNVICYGLGMSVCELMNATGFVDDECDEPVVPENYLAKYYLINRYQFGTGASSITPSLSTVSLGAPLVATQYGNVQRDVDIFSELLYKDEKNIVARQDFLDLITPGLYNNKIVYVLMLDESSGNGLDINEVGLFVQNPYLKKDNDGIDQPGHLLAAYRKFPPVQKQGYFSLMVRWEIEFA